MAATPSLSYDRKKLASPDPEIRSAMLGIMKEVKPASAYSDLLDLLIFERHEDVLGLIIELLKDFGTFNTVDLLEVFLLSPRTQTRILAIEAIASLGDTSSLIQLITPRIEDPEESVRLRAIKTLSKIPQGVAISEIKSLITHPQSSMRFAGLNTLSVFCDNDCIGLLNILASDPVPSMRLKTVHALFSTGNPLALPILRRLSQDMDIEVSDEALGTLERFSETTSSGSRLNEIFGSAAKPTSPEVSKKPAHDLSQIDEKIEAAMLSLGKTLHHRCREGIIREDKLATEIYKVDKVKTRITSKKSEPKESGLLPSLSKYMGLGVDEEVAQKHLEILLDESWIELGEAFFEIYQSDGTHHDLQSELDHIEALLHQRYGKRS